VNREAAPHPAPNNASHREIACPACGCMDATRAFTADDFMLGIRGPFFASRCARCGLLFQNPRVSPELLARHYPDDYGPYLGSEMRLPPAARRDLRDRLGYAHLETPLAPHVRGPWSRHKGRVAAEEFLIPAFVPGGRLLEIGCAGGARLSLLRELGWTRCAGIEWSATAAARARSRGFEVATGPVENALEEFPDAGLDAVVAGFVMEHLEDPFLATKRVAAKLRRGGSFMFSTLAIGAPDFRAYGRHWYDLDLPRHMTFFRKRDLARMLEGSFRVERITHLAAPQDWLGSAHYRLRDGAAGATSPMTRAFDRLVLAAGRGLRPACAALAAVGLTSRVAVRCVRN
jgi:SAM-dependent methyltransferase